MDDLKVQELQKTMMEKLHWLNTFHTKDKVDLLEALRQRFGDEVITIVEKVEAEKARRQWSKAAEQEENTGINDLIRLLWEPLRAKGFEYTTEKVEGGVQMKCTKCPIADLAGRLGAEKWLFHHTCKTDPFIAAAFNPRIGLKRTKTIMEGDEYCDHFYYLKE